MTNKRLLLVGAGTYQLPVLHAARRMHVDVIALDGDPDAAGFPLAAESHAVDIADVEACLAIARRCRPDGVLCVATEAGVRTTAAIADALALVGASPEAAAIATDKTLMRDTIETAGLPVPRWRAIRSTADAVAFFESVAACVVKPADSAGSRGVSYVGRSVDLQAAFELALANSPTKRVLIEEFLEGPEISVEAFVIGGRTQVLALSDKVRTPPPALLDTTVIFPSAVSADVSRAAVDGAVRAVEAAGVDNATVHMEQIVTSRGPMIVEFAIRGAGFRVFTDMVPWVTGVDTVAASIQLALGEAPSLEVRHNRGAVLRFPEAAPGVVRAVAGEAPAQAVAGVLEARSYVRPGDIVRKLASGRDRIGHIIALGETREDALLIASRAEALMRVDTEPAAA